MEYGLDDTYGAMTPRSERARSHDMPVVGLTPDTTAHYRVVYQEDDDALYATDDGTFETGSLPDWIPPMAVTGEPVDRYTLFSWWSVADMESAVVVTDRTGAIVWYVRPQQLAQTVRLSQDGSAVLFLDASVGRDPLAERVRVPLDGSEATRYLVPYAHHDFVEGADGTLAFLGSQLRVIDGIEIQGDTLVTIVDGETQELWNAFESLPMVENDGFRQLPADSTHANGLAWHERTRSWTLSLYWERSVVAIDEAGNHRWTLGGTSSDWMVSSQEAFGPQHSPRWYGDDLLLFDNAYGSDRSRLTQYTLDPTQRSAALSWSWTPPDALAARFMGDVVRLDDGSVLSAWAESEQVRWLRADGTEWMRMTFDADGMVGKVDHTDSLWAPDASFPNTSLPF